ncbi:hypothetical protein Dthio_PD0481 [Desulfonatronospira thiodismutans ASO3-1]|uniref:Antitoxin n=1 Tax=Desulfonatronospira thiodismutans ASO3-1 TaxID=555779 RepID=D6SR42_9BACT|nr:hypothetical protein [Desulfonatronospira thiodismutans]EFI33158.1 hypothetical protein Dthio_PD0481 [Desulfonatronospira thiodismutans ASO3-1]
MSKTMTSREFNQYAGQAKKAAEAGPVFITDRGKPCHVLLSALIRKFGDVFSMSPIEPKNWALTLLNPKSEYRNSKQIRNSNSPIPQFPNSLM